MHVQISIGGHVFDYFLDEGETIDDITDFVIRENRMLGLEGLAPINVTEKLSVAA